MLAIEAAGRDDDEQPEHDIPSTGRDQFDDDWNDF